MLTARRARLIRAPELAPKLAKPLLDEYGCSTKMTDPNEAFLGCT